MRGRALVCADADQGELSPGGDAVLYVAHGAAFVSAIPTMPRAAFEQQRQAVSRQLADSNGKQVGLALLTYAEEHGGALPPPGEALADALGAYLHGNDSLLDSFIYTYPGADLGGIGDPAEAQLGYVAAPGGRAVVYEDGHVTWTPDPAPGR